MVMDKDMTFFQLSSNKKDILYFSLRKSMVKESKQIRQGIFKYYLTIVLSCIDKPNQHMLLYLQAYYYVNNIKINIIKD